MDSGQLLGQRVEIGAVIMDSGQFLGYREIVVVIMSKQLLGQRVSAFSSCGCCTYQFQLPSKSDASAGHVQELMSDHLAEALFKINTPNQISCFLYNILPPN